MGRDDKAIVVGASTCGLACALVLAQQGFHVRVLEARSDPRSEAGARALVTRTREIAHANEALAHGDRDAAEERFRSAERARSSVWGSRNRNLLFDGHSLDFLRDLGVRVGGLAPLTAFDTDLGPGQPSIRIRYGDRRPRSTSGRLDVAAMLAQRDPIAVATIAELESLLRDATESTASIAIDYDAPVLRCLETDDAVSVSFGAPGARTATTDLLVIADGGGRRSLSRTLGIDRVEAGAERVETVSFICGTDRELLGHPLGEAWIDAQATRGGWVVFLNSGRGLLTVNTRHVVGADAPSALRVASEAGVVGDLAELPVDLSYRLDRAARFTNGSRTVIVGDAACRASPAWAFGAQFALLWAQMVGDLGAAAGVELRDRNAAVAAFSAEAERVSTMRLEFERNALRLVDFTNAATRDESDNALAQNLLAALDRAELDFKAVDSRGGRLGIRFGVDLRQLFGDSGSPDVSTFGRAVGRVDVDGVLDLEFDRGGGKSTQTRATPLDYRTRVGAARVERGTVSVRRDTEGWAITLEGADVQRTIEGSRETAVASIDGAELRLPDEFVTSLLQRVGPQLWALGAMQKHTLSYELELRPGIFEIGTFKLQLLGAPLVRVTIGREQRGARLAFKLLRGQALAESFSSFVRSTPIGATRPLRLWQTLLGGFADPFVDLYAATASRLVREVRFDVHSNGTGRATYDVGGLPLSVPMSKHDVESLVSRLFDSASCERLMRQYQGSMLAARVAPGAADSR